MLQRRRAMILAFIRRYIRENGYSPTLREIGDNVGLSSLSSITHQLDKLELEGMIRRQPNMPRTIQLVKEAGVGKDPHD